LLDLIAIPLGDQHSQLQCNGATAQHAACEHTQVLRLPLLSIIAGRSVGVYTAAATITQLLAIS